jgi:hypothetical protein
MVLILAIVISILHPSPEMTREEKEMIRREARMDSLINNQSRLFKLSGVR